MCLCLCCVQVAVTLFLALVVGAIFFDVKEDESGIQNRFSILLYSGLIQYIMYNSAFGVTVLSFSLFFKVGSSCRGISIITGDSSGT